MFLVFTIPLICRTSRDFETFCLLKYLRMKLLPTSRLHRLPAAYISVKPKLVDF